MSLSFQLCVPPQAGDVHWFSSFLVDEELWCVSGVVILLSGHGGAFAIGPTKFMSCKSLSHLSCCATLFPWFFNQWFLLATKWSIFSLVLKISKIMLPFLLACVPQLPFFPEYSRYSVVPPDPLATGFHPSTNAKFAVAWAASSFFWYSDALLLATLHNSSLLDSPHKQTSAFWRKKTAVQPLTNQKPTKHLHTPQPPPRRETQAQH